MGERAPAHRDSGEKKKRFHAETSKVGRITAGRLSQSSPSPVSSIRRGSKIPWRPMGTGLIWPRSCAQTGGENVASFVSFGALLHSWHHFCSGISRYERSLGRRLGVAHHRGDLRRRSHGFRE
ncbi:hypothetical protein GGC47_004941 [Bosea sp. OAE752]